MTKLVLLSHLDNHNKSEILFAGLCNAVVREHLYGRKPYLQWVCSVYQSALEQELSAACYFIILLRFH